MSLFRFPHIWRSLADRSTPLDPIVAELDDRDRALEDYLAFPAAPFTPTVRFGGTSVTVNDGTVAGAYTRIGSCVVDLWWEFGIGPSTVVPAGEMTVDFPVLALTTTVALEMGVGQAIARDVSAGAAYSLIAAFNSTSRFRLFKSWTSADTVSNTSPFTPAAGDTFGGYCRYHAVST